MQVNVAHSADVTVELEDHTIRPSQLFVKKSASSSNINETKFNGALQKTATNPIAAAHSLSSNAGWVMHVTCSCLFCKHNIVYMLSYNNHIMFNCGSRQPAELKGYVQMSSAGSVRPSKSLGDIASAGEDEQDTGIYVEPDRTGAALLLQAE